MPMVHSHIFDLSGEKKFLNNSKREEKKKKKKREREEKFLKRRKIFKEFQGSSRSVCEPCR